MAGWRGRTRAAREQQSPGEFALQVTEGQRFGKSRPAPANATVRVSSRVEIEVNGRAVSRSDGGAALAVLDTMGRLERRADWEPGDPLLMPVAEAEVGTLTVVTNRPCVSTAGRQVRSVAVDRPTRSLAVAADRAGTAILFVAASNEPTPVALGPDGDARPVRADVMDLDGESGRLQAEAAARAAKSASTRWPGRIDSSRESRSRCVRTNRRRC